MRRSVVVGIILFVSTILAGQCFATGLMLQEPAYVAEGLPPEWGFWLQPFYQSGKQENHKDILGYKVHITGFMLGVDNRFTENLTFGMGASAANTIVKSINFYDTKRYIDTYQGFLYAYYQACNKIFYHFIFTGAHNANNHHRGTTTPVNTTAYAHFAGQQYSGELTIGREQCYRQFFYTPKVMVDYLYFHQQMYRETGPGAVDHNIDDNFSDVLTLGIGVSLDRRFCIKTAKTKAELNLTAFYDAMNDKLNTTTAYMLGAPAIVTTADVPRLTGVVGLGFDINLPGRFIFKLNYDLQFKEHYYNNVVYAKIKATF